MMHHEVLWWTKTHNEVLSGIIRYDEVPSSTKASFSQTIDSQKLIDPKTLKITTLGSHWPSGLDLTSISLRCHGDRTSVSLRAHFGFTSISFRCHFGITSSSFRFHFDFTSMSLRFPFSFTLLSLRSEDPPQRSSMP